MRPRNQDSSLSHDLERARRAVLVQRPLDWRVAASLIAALERAWGELDARAAASQPADAGGATERPPTATVPGKRPLDQP